MIDIAYPLFGGAVLLVAITTSCLSRRVAHLNMRVAALENQRVPVAVATIPMDPQPQPHPQPHPQHFAVYVPPSASAPPALHPNMYYDDRARTAVI
jgi:hypothetical protein